MNTTHAAALPVGYTLHEYRVERILGHGGFGITYLATDTLLRKSVAIKEYLPIDYALRGDALAVLPRSERDQNDFAWGLERFLDEARTLARFRHPNVVPVMRFFEANGTGYMVMEFEDGQHAGDWFRSLGRPLTEVEARALMLPLLEGLETVHQAGYLHRDIKPGNIVIKRDGTPVLIDFGAARQALTGRSRTVTAIVTPRFAPLEQYSTEGVQGPWSDIYALAAVIYTGLAGEPPPEATARIPKDRFKPLSKTLAEGDANFLGAIDWALNIFAPDRPQTVSQWRDSLSQGAPSQRPTEALTTLAREADTSLAGAINAGERPVVASIRPTRGRRRIGLLAGVALALLAGTVWLARAPIGELYRQALGPLPAPMPAPNPPDTPPADPGKTPINRPPVRPNPPATPTTPPPIDALAAQATAKAVQDAQARAEAADGEVKRAEQIALQARETAEKARERAGEATAIVQNGVGLLELQDGGRYAGDVQNGRRHGFGITTYPSGDRLEGEWRDGRAQGNGLFVWNDGRSYLGQWSGGAQQGLGILQYPDGGRYAGQWSADQPGGLGQRLGADGALSSGEWRAGKLHGFAVERAANGRRFEGQFAEGRYSGRGALLAPDGNRQAGVWIDGALSRPD